MSDQTLTVAEIAEHLKLNPQTVRDWCKSGQLEAVNVGTPARAIWRVSVTSLERFKRSRRNQPSYRPKSAVKAELERFGVI